MKTKESVLRIEYALRLVPELEPGAKVLSLGARRNSMEVLLKKYDVRTVQYPSRKHLAPAARRPGVQDRATQLVISSQQFIVCTSSFETTRLLKDLHTAEVPGALLLVQREVGQKLLKRYGLVAAKLSVDYVIEHVCDVPSDGFNPCFKPSVVVALSRRSISLDVDMAALVEAFTHMRKQVKGCSKRPAELSAVEFEKVFKPVPAENLKDSVEAV